MVPLRQQKQSKTSKDLDLNACASTLKDNVNKLLTKVVKARAEFHNRR